MPDTVWDRLEPVLVGAGVKRIRNLRLRIEGVLWRLRTGAPWRDLPTELGSWSTVFSFFNRWSQKGLWRKVFELLRGELDDEWSFIDSSYVKVHQHAAGAAGTTKEKEAIGKSRGGNTSKLHTRCDAHGNPAQFLLTAGNVSDFTMADQLLKDCRAQSVMADKGYDSSKVRKTIEGNGSIPVIPTREGNHQPNPHFDEALYQLRHLIENLFARMKHFRTIATRYDKRARNFMSFVYLAAAMIWVKL
jgi:transposase